MKYTLGTLPVNRSVIARYKDEIRMLQAYGEKYSPFGGQCSQSTRLAGVREAFYPNIQNLLLGRGRLPRWRRISMRAAIML